LPGALEIDVHALHHRFSQCFLDFRAHLTRPVARKPPAILARNRLERALRERNPRILLPARP
jgi:hypothetical protein